MTTAEKRIMSEWQADLEAQSESDGWGDPIDPRVITRTLGELVAARVRGRCQWSQSSEAIYITAGERTMRIAAHCGGGVASQANGHAAPFVDIRLGCRHDETSTDLIDEPGDADEMLALAGRLSEMFNPPQGTRRLSESQPPEWTRCQARRGS